MPGMPKGERDGRVSAVPAAVLKSEGWPSHWGLARHFAKHPGDLKRRVGPVRNHAIRRAGRAGAEHFRLPKPRRCHEARRVRVRGSFETCGRLRPSAGVAGPAALSGGKTPPTPFLLRNVLPNASGSPLRYGPTRTRMSGGIRRPCGPAIFRCTVGRPPARAAGPSGRGPRGFKSFKRTPPDY